VPAASADRPLLLQLQASCRAAANRRFGPPRDCRICNYGDTISDHCRHKGNAVRKSITITGSALLALTLSVSAAGAAEIRVASVGATLVAAENIAKEFTKQTGTQVNLVFEIPAVLSQRLAKGEVFDALIQSAPAMDAVDRAGAIALGTRMKVARVGLGVVVKDSASTPDISTVDGFNKMMIAAKVIVYGDPVPYSTGILVVDALKRAGIYDEVRGKVKVAGLNLATDLIRKGEADLGFANVSEVRPGLKLAGVLPAPLQSYTNFEAAVMKAGKEQEAALAFVKYLASSSASSGWQAAALEPVVTQ
jgi:molybdate transport system substrate-binding protein